MRLVVNRVLRIVLCVLVAASFPALTMWGSAEDKGLDVDPLEAKLAELAGSQAVDCGRVAIKGNSQSVTTCVLDSFHSKKPFRVRYDLQGIDSSIAMGLVFSKGTLVEFWYDSYSGAGSHPDDKHFWLWTCPRPYAVHVNKRGEAVCSDRFAKN